MKFQRRVFQVKTNNQKYITIPSQVPIMSGDIVSIELVRTEKQEQKKKERAEAQS